MHIEVLGAIERSIAAGMDGATPSILCHTVAAWDEAEAELEDLSEGSDDVHGAAREYWGTDENGAFWLVRLVYP